MSSATSVQSQPDGISQPECSSMKFPRVHPRASCGADLSTMVCYSDIIMHELYRFIPGVVTRSSKKVMHVSVAHSSVISRNSITMDIDYILNTTVARALHPR